MKPEEATISRVGRSKANVHRRWRIAKTCSRTHPEISAGLATDADNMMGWGCGDDAATDTPPIPYVRGRSPGTVERKCGNLSRAGIALTKKTTEPETVPAPPL
jgi:hypothetical protein